MLWRLAAGKTGLLSSLLCCAVLAMLKGDPFVRADWAEESKYGRACRWEQGTANSDLAGDRVIAVGSFGCGAACACCCWEFESCGWARG